MANVSDELKQKRSGPFGLGDPDDRSLRKVEIEVLIPKKMREKARNEKCTMEVEDFNKCCLNNGIKMIYKCRIENNHMKSCLSKWYQNEEFQKECRDEYLNERSEYRRTGVTTKQRKKEIMHK